MSPPKAGVLGVQYKIFKFPNTRGPSGVIQIYYMDSIHPCGTWGR
jgi:hypothetical protein